MRRKMALNSPGIGISPRDALNKSGMAGGIAIKA
jgi:hypothetical protein